MYQNGQNQNAYGILKSEFSYISHSEKSLEFTLLKIFMLLVIFKLGNQELKKSRN